MPQARAKSTLRRRAQRLSSAPPSNVGNNVTVAPWSLLTSMPGERNALSAWRVRAGARARQSDGDKRRRWQRPRVLFLRARRRKEA
eukprot:15446158-Alexandrium_andersonii.AAC.2